MATNRILPEARHIALTADKEYQSGAPVAIGQVTGVSITTVKTGEPVSVHTDGSWEFEVTGTLTEGQAVYITSAGALTATASGNKPYGVALKAKGSGAGPVEVAPFGYVVPAAA